MEKVTESPSSVVSRCLVQINRPANGCAVGKTGCPIIYAWPHPAELGGCVRIHVQQIKRYETRTAQPSVEALIKLAKTLGVSTDALLFDPAERGPSDDLRLQFEALSQFSAEEKKVARAVIEGLILKHAAQRFANSEAS